MSCIEIKMLAKYISDRVTDNDKEHIEAHLSVCDECLEEFVVISKILRNSEDEKPISIDIAESILHELKIDHPVTRLVRWTFDVTEDMLFLKPAAVRKAKDKTSTAFIHYPKKLNDGRLDLYFEKTTDNRITIFFYVSYDSHEAEAVRVHLIHRDKGIYSRPLKNGKGHIDDLDYGIYDLELTSANYGLEGFSFEINNDGFMDEPDDLS